MRLIDADARVTVQSFDPMDEEYYHDEMTVERALDFSTDEGCPPTIPAIPVEWIFEQMQILHELHNKNEYVLQCLIEMWQKEQEARNESKV